MFARSPDPRNLLFHSLTSVLKEFGFTAKRRMDLFFRTREEFEDRFQLTFLRAIRGWRVQPNVSVRVTYVEEIFHKISGFEPRYTNETSTIGTSVGNVLHGSARRCEISLASSDDVGAATKELSDIFAEIAIPYFEKFSSLAAIDFELNEMPLVSTRHRGVPWLRCSAGLIVARLVNRGNYRELVNTYRRVIQAVDGGYDLPKYDALVEQLNTVAPRVNDDGGVSSA